MATDLQRVRKALAAAPNLMHVRRSTGVSYRQLINLRDGISANPKLETLDALKKHFGFK